MTEPSDGSVADGLPERDPLADLVSRSVGRRVEHVDVEVLDPWPEHVERKRLRFTTDAGQSSAIFQRSGRGIVTEAQLLPFLARKTPHVPIVHSRGLPPPHATFGPWLLLEDVFAASGACDGDPVEILRAKFEVERAVKADVPAMRALGLRVSERLAPVLASAPLTLVHGYLRCDRAFVLPRGVVIAGWAFAHLGPAVVDVVSLSNSLTAAGDAGAAERVREFYIGQSGDAEAPARLAEAERVIVVQ